MWQASQPEKLASLRKDQRDEERLLEAHAFGVFSTLSSDTPLNLNTATAEELQQIKGVGTVIANRIVESQPYSNLGELLEVDGIGPSLLEKMKPFVRVITKI